MIAVLSEQVEEETSYFKEVNLHNLEKGDVLYFSSSSDHNYDFRVVGVELENVYLKRIMCI